MSLSKRVVVIGAGPAGLTAAYELGKHSIPVTVLEMDPRQVGGIARTTERSGYRFDIGGHRFFSKNQEIEDLWTEILGDELLVRGRQSRIYYRGRYFDYPLRPLNALNNLGWVETLRCILSFAWAKVHPRRPVRSFEDWVSNQFGRRLFRIFFKTYTEKVWGTPTTEISADWAAQRIQGLNLVQVIRSALVPQRGAADRGRVIKTLIDEFRYPRLGPGQMWERVAAVMAERGEPVRHGLTVTRVEHGSGRVSAVVAKSAAGTAESFEATDFISSMPLRDLVQALDPPPPPAVLSAAASLSYRDFLTVAAIVDRPNLMPFNWVYVHDPDVIVGRIQNFKVWSPDMVPDPAKSCLGLEYFCFEGDGLWSRSDENLVELARTELVALGLVRPAEVEAGFVVRQAKAYPVYDDDYQQHVAVIREWMLEAVPNLYLAGRNGMHKYNNQDHSMMTALVVARNIALDARLDPWKVNADAEYHEVLREGDDRGGRMVPARLSD